LSRGHGQVSLDMDMVMLCDYMKWDYYTYNSQPAWFLDLLRLKINSDNYYQRKSLEKKGR